MSFEIETLFTRKNGEFIISEEAKILIPFAQNVVALAQNAKKEIKSYTNGVEGKIFIGAGTTWSLGNLPKALAKTSEKFPKLEIDLNIEAPDLLLNKLSENKMDIIFARRPENISNYDNLEELYYSLDKLEIQLKRKQIDEFQYRISDIKNNINNHFDKEKENIINKLFKGYSKEETKVFCDLSYYLGNNMNVRRSKRVINMYNIIDTNEEKKEEKEEKKEKKEEQENNELSIIGFYLINKSEIINKDNYKLIGISQYLTLLTRTLSQCIIDKKKEKTDINKNKYKIITIDIPCDIMTFIKLDATHDDINNIINIAYNISLDELNLSKITG